MCEFFIMCAVTDLCLHDYDVILPAAVLGNLQANAVVSKGLCDRPTVCACCKEQPCVELTTADRLSSGTKLGTAVGSKPRSSHADSKPKCNLGCGMSHRAYAVAMLCILCVALTVCIAICFVTDDRNVMLARVLTPATVMLSCMLPSQRIEEDKFAHLQPEPQQERHQLLDEFADHFDDRPGRCDAVVHQVQTTDGLVRRQMRPCCAPDVCPVSRPIRPTNSSMARLIVLVLATRTYPDGEMKRDGGVRIACNDGYLNLVTVGDAFLMPPSTKCCAVSLSLAETYKIAATTLNLNCCHDNKVKTVC